jgi:hypothetical protein
MQTNQPILSCAGREAVSIDSAILNQLLLSFTPNTIGIRQKARDVSQMLEYVADGRCDNALEEFKNIITTEFLSVQLMEAAQLAKQTTAVVSGPVDCF